MSIKILLFQLFNEEIELCRKSILEMADIVEGGYERGKLTDIAMDLAGAKSKLDCLIKDAEQETLCSAPY